MDPERVDVPTRTSANSARGRFAAQAVAHLAQFSFNRGIPEVNRSEGRQLYGFEPSANRLTADCVVRFEQTVEFDSMALFTARLLRSRPEVELTFTLLIKDAIGSRTAATHVHPVARHDHN